MTNTSPARYPCLLACIAIVLAGYQDGAAAQDDTSATTSWSVQGQLRAGLYSSDRLLSDDTLAGAAALRINAQRDFSTLGRARFDAEVIRQRDSLHDHDRLRPRNVTWGMDAGPGRLTAGWMSLNFGKADAVNPSDFFVSYDYTLLQPLESDWRNARLAMRYEWPLDEGSSITLIAAPYSDGNRLPRERELSKLPRQSGDGFGDGVEIAIRYEMSASSHDWSITGWRGITKDPVLKATPDGIVREYPRSTGFGTDAATNMGNYSLRAEAAYQWLETPPSSGVSNFFFAVAGIERNFDSLNIGAQLLYRRATTSPPIGSSPLISELVRINGVTFGQSHRDQYGSTLRLTYRNAASKWESEAFLLHYTTPVPSTYARASVGYKPQPQYKLSTGLERYAGSGHSYFGALRENNLVYAEYQVFFE